VLRGVRAGMLAVASRCAQRLPRLNVHVAQIDAEIKVVLPEVIGARAKDAGVVPQEAEREALR
jgi:hypothetical protein